MLSDYDVSLHNLVVIIVMIPTSPRLSKTEFICKSYGVLILLLDLPRRWSGVSGSTGVSAPKDPESPASCFSLPNDFVWCGTGLGSGGTPEMVRSLRPDRSLRPEDPESPVSAFSRRFCVCVVPLWCWSGATPEGSRDRKSVV